MYVDSVHDRSGELRNVGLAAGRAACASVAFAVITAWTWVRGSDEHEIGGELDLRLEAGDDDLAVFHRCSEDLQNLLRCLAEFVDHEHATMCERYFPGHYTVGAAADKGGNGSAVMRRTERTGLHQSALRIALSSY